MFDSLGDSLFHVLVFIGFGLWCMKRQLSKADPEGKVKTAARDGLVRMLSRWFK